MTSHDYMVRTLRSKVLTDHHKEIDKPLGLIKTKTLSTLLRQYFIASYQEKIDVYECQLFCN